ncbi:MAG: MFS transporter [Acidimicrobiia bacterium]|nr:MFS transporter [Acidimicrobiia bacterium]
MQVDGTAPRGQPPELDSRRAWRAVVAAFLSMFAVFGVAYSFGAFFAPMSDEFGSGRSATSLVFSITAFLYFVLGALSGPAVDRFGPRPVLLTGAAVMGAGLLLTSRVQSIEVGYLTYGLGVGIGVACGYVPMVATVGGWFERRRSAALGVAVAGIGLGTVVASPLAASLINRLGWRTTYVVFAAASTIILVAAAVLAERPPRPVTAAATLPLGQAIRTRPFLLLYGSAMLLSLALFQVFVYLPDFAEDQGAGEVAAAGLVAVVAGASIAGRLLLGTVADRVGRIRTYQACFLVMGLSYGIWLVAPAYPWLVAFAVVMGGAYGGFIALSPAVVAEVFGTTSLGGLIGFLYTGAGFGALVGPPLAGELIDTSGYRWAIGASMAVALAAWIALLPLERAATTTHKP